MNFLPLFFRSLPLKVPGIFWELRIKKGWGFLIMNKLASFAQTKNFWFPLGLKDFQRRFLGNFKGSH